MTKRTARLLAPLVLALATAALAAPSSSSAASTTSAACVPGKTTVGGKQATRFCGPAKATAKVGSKTFHFSGGVCQVAGLYFQVNIGTVVNNKLANAKPGPLPYFNIALTPATTGVHLTQGLTWIFGGKRYSPISNKITIDQGLKSGSFTGKSIGGAKVKGTFTCS
jgi:hypothetical protein